MTTRRRSVFTEPGSPSNVHGVLGGSGARGPSFPSSQRDHGQTSTSSSVVWNVVRNLMAGDPLHVLGLLVSLAGLWFLTFALLGRTHRLPPAPCNAFAAPGRLLVNLTHPLSTQWLPLDEDACPSLPRYLPALWDLTKGASTPVLSFPLDAIPASYQLLQGDSIPRHFLVRPGKEDPDAVAFLRKRRSVPPTVLILGDSVDRNGVTHFCQLMQQNVSISLYGDINDHPPDPLPADLTKSHGPRFRGWDQRGLPHLCEIPFYSEKQKKAIAMRIVNGFHYGMDALDEFDTPDHLDWHRPGRVELRIDELIVPMLDQMGGTEKVDLVILHSGMWDLALFGLQDDKTNWSLTVPLTPEQLAWWQERMRHTIYHLRATFPRARIVYRKLHRTDDVVAGTQYITNRPSPPTAEFLLT